MTFNDGSRGYQDRFDTRRLADRIDERLVRDWIDDDDRAFVERCDMLFLATADADGRPQCSYKGGEPGFVHVVDEHTIAFPNYDGNGMFLSAGNAVVNPHVGLLFISFEERKRMRLNGIAEHVSDDSIARRVPGGAVPLARAGDRSVPELSALHPPLRACRALALRAEDGVRDTGARVEATRVGARRARRGRPCERLDHLDGEDGARLEEPGERLDHVRVELRAGRLVQAADRLLDR